ncbi:MAG: PKD domain protein [Syntrophus sp. PtaB.Bin001]|nr:MAG: PKD domain protein [Syntrophus sp. PtaB.Bin001]
MLFKETEKLFPGKIDSHLLILSFLIVLLLIPSVLSAQTTVQLLVNKRQVNTGEPVTFTAVINPTPQVPVEYLFDFGDGSGPVRGGNTAEHAYAVRGTYSATVKAVVQTRNRTLTAARGSVSRETVAASSDPVLVLVVAPEPPPQNFQVRLSVDRQQVNTGEPVAFTAAVTPNPQAPVEYLFDFGDGSGPVSGGSTMEHAYESQGRYYATVKAVIHIRSGIRAEMLDRAQIRNVTVGSNRVLVRVAVPEPPPPRDIQVRLSADRQQVNAGEAVKFTVVVNPTPPFPFEYLFDFGDGSDPVRTDESRFEHIYETGGDFSAMVRIVGETEELTSNSIDIHVIAPGPAVTYPDRPIGPDQGRRLPWVPIIIIAAGIGLFVGVYKLWGRSRGKTTERGQQSLRPSEMHCVPHSDKGVQAMEFAKPGPLSCHVSLLPIFDGGRQELDVEGPLTLAERRET